MAKCVSTIIVLFVLIHYYSIVNAAFLVSYCGCHEYIALAIGSCFLGLCFGLFKGLSFLWL